jgi:hypothetical protein
MMMAMLGLVFWVLMVLIPELCLAFRADAEKLGATMMGNLVSLIVALPGLLLAPLALVYAMQYHGRVLVSSAMGEVVPPRPPDRNFDGLLNGLGPWLVWFTCGATIGFGPIARAGRLDGLRRIPQASRGELLDLHHGHARRLHARPVGRDRGDEGARGLLPPPQLDPQMASREALVGHVVGELTGPRLHP